MPRDRSINDDLRAFAQRFDVTYEDKAVTSRGRFLRAFPRKRLRELTVDEYVIGMRTASFCAYVEAKTKRWAAIQGSPAFKFGIYFGKTKRDPKKRYRVTRKFGKRKAEGFRRVKEALLALIKAGQSKHFERIDQNPLSQMFKAKILSLYFPDDYLNVCSSEHLRIIASGLGISKRPYTSEYQHLLAKKKLENPIARHWTNPKFMRFLYSKFIRKEEKPVATVQLKNPRRRLHPRVDFDEIVRSCGEIGKKSEGYALDWEKTRLIGLGYSGLAGRIEDRRDRPSYGYDFLSYSSPTCERYIEVKTAAKVKQRRAYRFYLSDNQRTVSKQCGPEYYFYLVFYDDNGQPCGLLAKRARDVYAKATLSPCAYEVICEIVGPIVK